MQKRLIIGTFFSFFLIMVFQGCNNPPVPLSETSPWFNAVQIEPNVKWQNKYVTIFGSYIQFQVIPADSDRIDTSFSYLWHIQNGTLADTLDSIIETDTYIKNNVVRWHPEEGNSYCQVYVNLSDNRGGIVDKRIDTRVLPYKYEGEIVDSSLQMPMGFGISSDKIAILDAKNMVVNFYSKTGLNLTGSLILPDLVGTKPLDNPVDIVFDEYDRMYISSAEALVRFIKDGSGKYVYDTAAIGADVSNGRYFCYNNGKIYLTLNAANKIFTVYDTTLNNILAPVRGPSTFSRMAPRGGIIVDNVDDIYVLYADVDGIPYLRKYDQNGNLLVDNLLPLDSLPDSTYFYSAFYMNYNLYICGSSPGWDGVQLANRTDPKLGWKWGTGGSSGPDRFSSIVDATARGDTFYLLDAGNKALKIFTYIH